MFLYSKKYDTLSGTNIRFFTSSFMLSLQINHKFGMSLPVPKIIWFSKFMLHISSVFFTTCHAQQVIIHFNTVISSNPHYLCVTLNLPSCILHFNYMVHCSSFMIENAFVALNFSNNKECNKFLFWLYCSVLYREWRWYFIAA